MNKIFSFIITISILLVSVNPLLAISESNELPKCIVLTHCVLENWKVSNVDNTFQLVLKAIETTPRTKVVEKTESYIHAEAKTKSRRYTDDLLLKALPEKSVIQVRSESRVGIGDMGVNQKRVDNLAYRLSIIQN